MGKKIEEELFGGPDSPDEEAQTPAAPDERIEGSDIPDGAASSPRKAAQFEYSNPVEEALRDKVETWNREFEDASDRNDEVEVPMVRAVFRRGMGAYSETHDPDVDEGMDGRRDWGFARVNEFLERAANLDENAGFEVEDEYRQDDDLLPRGFGPSTLEDDEVSERNGPDLR
jgi:hypothetical protein